MFHVSRDCLSSAFGRHLSASHGDQRSDSLILLRIYAVECGLKALLLRTRRMHSTSQLDEDDLIHDLDALLRKVGQRPRFGSYQLDSSRRDPIDSGTLHEAFRYGARLQETGRSRLMAALDEVTRWIAEQED